MPSLDATPQAGEFTHVAYLDQPAVGLLTPGRLYALIFAELKPFGVGVNDVRFESTTVQLADQSISCSVPRLEALVRFRLDRIEVWANANAILGPMFGELTSAAFRVLNRAADDARLVSHTLSRSLLAKVPDGAFGAWISGFAGSPATENVATNVVGISLATTIGSISGSIVVEEVATEGESLLRIRTITNQDGTLSGGQAFVQARRFFVEALPAVGIQLLKG